MNDTDKYSSFSSILHYAGFRYWTLSLLPVLVGTTLPFWLIPSGFTLKWFAAFEFFMATLFFHAGFSFLHASLTYAIIGKRTKSKLLWIGIIGLMVAVLIGLHLNSNLHLNTNVYKYIFLVFGAAAIFSGALYILPPFNFHKNIGGEMIFCVGLGMMPVLGAYLIQVGDLNRTVYLASLPLVVSTGLWLWVKELIIIAEDKIEKYSAMVMLFTPQFSARYGTILLAVLIYVTLMLAVFGRSSLNPLSLIALLTCFLAIKIVTISWNEWTNIIKMRKALRYAFILHFTIGIIIIISSLLTHFF